MIVEVVALGLVSALRPATSQAAVIALLRTPRAQRSLLAFTVAGLSVSVAVGLLIVIVFDGAGSAFGRSKFSSVFDVVAGVAALAFAAGIERGRLTERIRNRRAARGPRPESRLIRRLRNPSTVTAAFAGVATHVPGLIYLVAMNAIAAERLDVARSTFQVVLYNALWFALPMTAFAVATVSPATAEAYLDRASSWARDHQDRLLVVLFAALGVYLVLKGSVALL